MVCMYQGGDLLWVINLKAILSVVAMVPFPYTIDGSNDYYFMVEKVGLDVLDVDTQDNE